MTAEEMREMCAAEMDRINMPTCARIIRALPVVAATDPLCMHSMKLTTGPDSAKCVKCHKAFKRERRWEMTRNPLTDMLSRAEADAIDAAWKQTK